MDDAATATPVLRTMNSLRFRLMSADCIRDPPTQPQKFRQSGRGMNRRCLSVERQCDDEAGTAAGSVGFDANGPLVQARQIADKRQPETEATFLLVFRTVGLGKRFEDAFL